MISNEMQRNRVCDQTLRIIWVKCIPLSLRTKTRRRATPLLPTWIYSCRSRETVSCALSFTTNVTISTSISQTFRSWVAIFHLPCFYLTAHTVCQGLLLLWMFYSKGGATFIWAPRTGICDGTFEIVPQEVLWSILGSHQTLWSLPFPNVTWHSGTWPCTMTPSIDQTLHQLANLLPNWILLPILTLLPNFGGFHGTLQRVRLANRGRLLLRTHGPVPFGTCICSNVDTILSWTCHVYGPFDFRTSLGTSILLCDINSVNLFLDWRCEIISCQMKTIVDGRKP